jgi:hypothetical protein
MEPPTISARLFPAPPNRSIRRFLRGEAAVYRRNRKQSPFPEELPPLDPARDRRRICALSATGTATGGTAWL